MVTSRRKGWSDQLESNPEFLARIADARDEIRRGLGTPIEDVGTAGRANR